MSTPIQTLTPATKPWQQDAFTVAWVSLAHASSHFAQLLLPPLFPAFMREFGLSYAQLGLLMTAFFVVSGVGQALSGFVVDRFGALRILLMSVGCFALACLAGSLAQSYAALFVVAALAGLGNAAFHPIDFSILNQRVQASRLGYAYSAHGLTGSLGWAAAPLFFTVALGFMSWRTAYASLAVAYAVLLVLLWMQRGHLLTQPQPHAGKVSAGQSFGFMRLPVVWWCFAFALFSTVTLAIVQNYLPGILLGLFSLPLQQGAMVLSGYLFLSAIGVGVGGWLASRYAQQCDRVLVWVLSAGALLLIAALLPGMPQSLGIGLVALTGLAVGMGGPSRDLMIKQGTPAGATGRVYGTVYSGFDVGLAIAPLVLGVWMDKGWHSATLSAAALALLCAVGTALGVRRYAKIAASK